MAKNSSKRREIEYRRMLVAQLYHRGYRTQRELAEQLGGRYGISVDRSTISRDLKEIEKRWRRATQIDFDVAKGQTIDEIEHLKLEYYLAWERSCEDAETVKQKGTPPAAGAEADKVTTTSIEKIAKGQSGDPRFLAGIQWCIERRCKIMGIDAAQKLDIQIDDLDVAIERELAKLAAAGQAAATGEAEGKVG